MPMPAHESAAYGVMFATMAPPLRAVVAGEVVQDLPTDGP
jgi:hypothetical protein